LFFSFCKERRKREITTHKSHTKLAHSHTHTHTLTPKHPSTTQRYDHSELSSFFLLLFTPRHSCLFSICEGITYFNRDFEIMEPWSDDAVVLQTSCGAVVIDLFTVDVPAGAQWIMDIVRSHVVNGATAAGLVHGGLMRLECPAVSMTVWSSQQRGASLGPFLSSSTSLDTSAKRVLQSGTTLHRGSSSAAPTVAFGPRLRFSGRPGLVLLPRRPQVEERWRQQCSSSSLLFCYLLLTPQNFDFLEDDFAPVGQVREGLQTLHRMKYRFIGGSGGGGGVVVKPTRLIRVKQAAVLTDTAAKRQQQQSSDVTTMVALNNAALTTSQNFKDVAIGKSGEHFVIVEGAAPSHHSGGWTVSLPCTVRYNPHCQHSGVLSSDDDDDPNQPMDDAQQAVHQRKLDETRSLMLNVLDGITDTGITAPENVLFVCKLNPLTTSEGLATCFAQFGKVLSSEVLKDPKGNSRCYAFVEFAEKSACDRAVQKMDKALIDDCRIHVDFSQSVSKAWASTKRHQTTSSLSTMRKRERES
jgi:hypothetical protein